MQLLLTVQYFAGPVNTITRGKAVLQTRSRHETHAGGAFSRWLYATNREGLQSQMNGTAYWGATTKSTVFVFMPPVRTNTWIAPEDIKSTVVTSDIS